MTHPLIIKASEATGIPVSQIMSRSRIQRICWVRFAIMAELRQTGLTLDRIGAILDRSPNAVISGLEQAFALRTLPAFSKIRSALA